VSQRTFRRAENQIPQNKFDISENRLLIKEITKYIKENMNPEYYVIFNLYFVEEYKANEISKQLGTTPEKIYMSVQVLARPENSQGIISIP